MTKKTCEDCACLIEKNGIWCCDECFGQPITEIDDCPEGVTEEVISEIESKKIKVETGAKSDKERKKRAPRELDADKVALIERVFNLLDADGFENVAITNKTREIDFSYKNCEYTLTMVKHRPKKK